MNHDPSLDWQQRYAHLLDALPAATRQQLIDSIQSNVIEGFEPTEADVRFFVNVALGRSDDRVVTLDLASLDPHSLDR